MSFYAQSVALEWAATASSAMAASTAGFKFNFFDSLLKLASGIIFYLLNLSANLLFHTYKHC